MIGFATLFLSICVISSIIIIIDAYNNKNGKIFGYSIAWVIIMILEICFSIGELIGVICLIILIIFHINLNVKGMTTYEYITLKKMANKESSLKTSRIEPECVNNNDHEMGDMTSGVD